MHGIEDEVFESIYRLPARHIDQHQLVVKSPNGCCTGTISVLQTPTEPGAGISQSVDLIKPVDKALDSRIIHRSEEFGDVDFGQFVASGR
jgi:hypothetical protein